MKTKIAINGAAGRMGQRLIALAAEDAGLEVVAALEAAGHPRLGQDAGDLAGVGKLDLPIRAELPLSARVEAVIDFSSPEGTMSVLPTCVDRRLPLVLATTGHTPEQKREIDAAAHHTAVLMAPNMSLVVNVLFALVRQASMMLRDKDFDVEIVEQHHRFKKDAPSGTALHFARIIQEAMGAGDIRHGREGLTGERSRQEIGMHALRRRRQRRRAHHPVQHPGRGAGAGPPRPLARQLRPRRPAGGQVPRRQAGRSLLDERRAGHLTHRQE